MMASLLRAYTVRWGLQYLSCSLGKIVHRWTSPHAEAAVSDKAHSSKPSADRSRLATSSTNLRYQKKLLGMSGSVCMSTVCKSTSVLSRPWRAWNTA